jgi:hypothetical protein
VRLAIRPKASNHIVMPTAALQIKQPAHGSVPRQAAIPVSLIAVQIAKRQQKRDPQSKAFDLIDPCIFLHFSVE